MRAVGYFRVSDEEQMEGWSPDAQKRGFEEFCQLKSWEIVGTYDEEWRSAWVESIEKRPCFKRMLEDARRGMFDVVVVHTLDRFSRNLRVMLEAFHIFSQNNVVFVCIQQQIDYTTPEGKLFMMLLGAFAQYFSDAISGHTKKGMKERVQQGLFNGIPPFGYERCTSECFGLDEHPGCHVLWEKASKVKELFVKYAGGNSSLVQLARWLNDQGMTTNYKRGVRLYDGSVVESPRSFTGDSVRWILHNSFYVGKVKYGDQEFQGVHQPLIDEDLFDEVQRRSTMARSRTHHRGLTKNPYLLMGLARCAHCGQPLWAETSGRGRVRYYREPLIRSVGACVYSGRSINGGYVEDQMNMIFENFKMRSDWKDWVTERLDARGEQDVFTTTKVSLEGKLSRLRHLYLEGDIAQEAYDRGKREIRESLDSLTLPKISATIRGR